MVEFPPVHCRWTPTIDPFMSFPFFFVQERVICTVFKTSVCLKLRQLIGGCVFFFCATQRCSAFNRSIVSGIVTLFCQLVSSCLFDYNFFVESLYNIYCFILKVFIIVIKLYSSYRYTETRIH